MVARINTGKNISKALNYNEQKVQDGKAEILAASGFVKELKQLNFYDKLHHFERLTALNERATTNTLHVSLNFDPSERLTNEKLAAIADCYMRNIGFGEQPYLVYRHDDAGHPHIHIVSTNIKSDGSRISMHNLGRHQSEKARKEIEVNFGLVKAESKKTSATPILPVNVQKVIYGKAETKRAIANVLMMVLTQYKYSSLPELNAILQLYNIRAEKGNENSRLFKNRGLVYRVLNEKGEKVGTPIKASAFYMKPTLSALEKQFMLNGPLKEPHKKRMQASIQWILHKEPKSLAVLMKELEKEKISVVLRAGKGNLIYGITYVDHQSKTVFNGSDLGKGFCAKAILEKIAANQIVQHATLTQQAVMIQPNQSLINRTNEKEFTQQTKEAGIVEHLLSPLPTNDSIPYALKKKKKRKKKQLSI